MANEPSGLFQRYIKTYNILKGGNVLERIQHKLLEDAEAGDLQAIKLVNSYSIPTLKSVTEAVGITLPDGTPAEQIDALFLGLVSGSYTPEQVLPLIDILKVKLDAQQLERVQDNLKAMEKNFGIPEHLRGIIYG